MMNEATRAEILERLKTLVLSAAPNAEFVPKYGGIIVQSVPGQTKSHFCGFFGYINHVSLEFSNGAQFDDPEKTLEGSGQYHHHLKFFSLSDKENKRGKEFLVQAANLQNSLT